MFKVAGRGGGGGGGRGGYGGGASGRENTYGGRGAYGGGGRESGGGGGSGASGASPGAAVHFTFNGPVMTDNNSQQQFWDQVNQQVQGGSLWVSSSNASIQGPTATGRG